MVARYCGVSDESSPFWCPSTTSGPWSSRSLPGCSRCAAAGGHGAGTHHRRRLLHRRHLRHPRAARRRRSAESALVRHEKNQGKGAAVRTAIQQATGDFCLVQDADLEYDPAEYPALLRPLLDGHADAVFGSRYLAGEQTRVLPFWHSHDQQGPDAGLEHVLQPRT